MSINDTPPQAPSQDAVPATCRHCDGTGWRFSLFLSCGGREVWLPCECVRPRTSAEVSS